ncbi:MAG TPA: L-threonylcarbamoyladenylate synthase [Candidatus Dormibacteraeota bacterium]|nr:L-threonylcarbamoyladenylate synthase [Candidatus Dormibacteraeota bacterium]
MIVPATPDTIARAAALLRDGAVVAFPTETVYGLGADATNAVAVAHIFSIKNRPSFDPLIVHLADAGALPTVAAACPDAARRLAAHYWPGPLTIVLPKTDRVPDIVTAGLPSVAVRVPDHPVARQLIAAADRPIAAPSANPFGYVSPTTAQHVAAQLGDAVPMILDGGPCRVGVESTIVSFLAPVPILLRPGAITLEMLEAELGEVHVGVDAPLPTAPGQLPRHYAPHTPVEIVADIAAIAPAARAGTALLSCAPVADTAGFAHVEVLSPSGDLEAAAARLFAALRALDGGGCSHVYAVAVPERGIGRAIMDRLRRAGAM